jgi:hypothetical protein
MADKQSSLFDVTVTVSDLLPRTVKDASGVEHELLAVILDRPAVMPLGWEMEEPPPLGKITLLLGNPVKG